MQSDYEVAPIPAPDRAQLGRAPRADQRSRVTNHADLLPGVNGNTATARRFRDLVRGFLVDAGGLDQCSEVKLGLLRRLAAVTVQAEQLEARLMNGNEVDVATLCTLASTAMRLSVRLGLERVAKDVSPSLSDLILQDEQRRAAPAARAHQDEAV